jgi:hypothetical protein
MDIAEHCENISSSDASTKRLRKSEDAKAEMDEATHITGNKVARTVYDERISKVIKTMGPIMETNTAFIDLGPETMTSLTTTKEDDKNSLTGFKMKLNALLTTRFQLPINKMLEYETEAIPVSSLQELGVSTSNFSKSAVFVFQSTLKFLIYPYNENLDGENALKIEFSGSICESKKLAEQTAAAEALEYLVKYWDVEEKKKQSQPSDPIETDLKRKTTGNLLIYFL